MKKLQTLLVVFLLATSISIKAQEGTDTLNAETNIAAGNLIVRILDISSDEGTVRVALSNSEDGYNSDNAFKVFESEIKDGVVEYTFENIPFGTYAIKCYHDENGNKKLDSNMFGMPTEDYGFSNNARGSFGPAKYNDAKFEFTTNNQVIKINLD